MHSTPAAAALAGMFPAGWGAELVGTTPGVDASDDASSADLIAVLADLERVKAWTDAAHLAIVGVLAERLEREYVDHPESWHLGGGRAGVAAARREARSVLADEIALATGLSLGDALDRVDVATAPPARAGAVTSLLRDGLTCWSRVRTVHTETDSLPEESVESIVRAVFAPTRDGAALPWALFRSRLRRQVLRHTPPKDAEDAAADVARARQAAVTFEYDGSARLTATGPTHRVAAAFARVDGAARALRRDGDPRTLAQLRCDIALDLLTFGDVPDAHPVGQVLAPARVDVVVSLATLLGLSNQPGMLTGPGGGSGLGLLSAATIRDVAHASGSTWRRLVTDPLTGGLVELGTASYQAPERLREAVIARDVTCRAPGCLIPARVADLDHDLDHRDGGPTDAANLSAKHRRHHQHKTTRLWSTHQDPDGTIAWTTWAGARYTTRPYDYNEHLDPQFYDDPDNHDTGMEFRSPLPRPRRRLDDDPLAEFPDAFTDADLARWASRSHDGTEHPYELLSPVPSGLFASASAEPPF